MFWVPNEISSHLNVFLAVIFTQWLIFLPAALRIPEGGGNEYYDEVEDKSSMSSHVFANASLFSVHTAWDWKIIFNVNAPHYCTLGTSS